MIDTIHLYTPYFSVDKKGKGWVESITENKDTGEVMEKLFNNQGTVKITANNRFLYANFTAIGLLQGKGKYEYDYQELSELTDSLKKEFDKLGVRVDMESLKVGRFDIYKNIEVERIPSYYINLIQPVFYNARYKKKVDTFKSSTLTLYNRSRELCIYDKRQDFKEKYGIDIGKNILRSEVRLKKHRIVEKRNIDTLTDLISMQEVELKKIYNREVKDKMVNKALLLHTLDLNAGEKYILGQWLSENGIDLYKSHLLSNLTAKKISERSYYYRMSKARESLSYYLALKRDTEKELKDVMERFFYDV